MMYFEVAFWVKKSYYIIVQAWSYRFIFYRDAIKSNAPKSGAYRKESGYLLLTKIHVRYAT